MKKIALLAACMLIGTFAQADIQMPKKPNFYDRMGQGLANIIYSPVEILDSTYALTEEEGPTVGWSKGLVQGTSRMVMNIFVGTFQIVSSPFPLKNNPKQPAYDTLQVTEYPPADLQDNWY
jgi:putative exosortase-associated protein (TIGR04073 family)